MNDDAPVALLTNANGYVGPALARVLARTGHRFVLQVPRPGRGALATAEDRVAKLRQMVLSYPEMPADVLAGRPLARRRVCRTFSDCTTAPRKGLPSGCYPLDPFYAARPEASRPSSRRTRTGWPIARPTASRSGTAS